MTRRGSGVPAHGMTKAAIAAWRRRWGKGPFVTVDLAAFTFRPPKRLALLLIRRGHPPFEGRWALPGGFLQADEGLETAARRELAEETGVADLGDAAVEQLATYGDPDRDPRGRILTVVFTALVPFDRLAHARGADDAAEAGFFDVKTDAKGGRVVDERGRRVPLACDHERIVEDAIAHVRPRLDAQRASTAHHFSAAGSRQVNAPRPSRGSAQKR
jgi:8-oxo-dGTP diphosphatase